MNADELDSLTERVLGAVFEVTNTLGAGFLEKVYQRCKRGFGDSPDTAKDLLVEDVLVVEQKCVDRFSSEHTAQGLNYLRASGRSVCLLVNFQKPKVEWKRIVHGFPVSEPLEMPAVAR